MPLEYWYDNKFAYPILVDMALNYLKMPTTTIVVDFFFSLTKNVLQHERYNLDSE
jgi:hypothetical protein